MIKRLQKGIQAATEKQKPKDNKSVDPKAPTNVSAGSSTSGTSDVSSDSLAAQNFLCPVCMLALSSPEDLQQHYESEHAAGSFSSDDTNSKTETLLDQQSFDFAKPGHEADSNGTGLLTPESPESREGRTDSVSSASSLPRCDSAAGAFTCPQCMNEFSNAVELQSHFQALHEVSENRDGDVLAMRLELNDLRASLKEEKWYSTELKKELEKLQGQLHERSLAAPVAVEGEDEMTFFLQQIQVLEAGKALATSKMLENEKVISELRRTNETLKREKERIVQKTITLSKENASLKSQLDIESSQKIALGDEVLDLRERVNSVQTALDHRPSEDDVDVLRKELVHAQTLMDRSAQDTETELDTWKAKCSSLEDSLKQTQALIDSLKAQLESSPKADSVAELQSTLFETIEQLQQSVSCKDGQVDSLNEDLKQVRSQLQDKSQACQEAETSAKQLGEQLECFKKELCQAQSQLKLMDASASGVSEEFTKLKSRFEAKSAEAESLKQKLADGEQQSFASLKARDEEIGELKISLQKAENSVKEKESQLEDLQRQLVSLQTQFQDQSAFENELKSTLREKEGQVEEAQRENDKKSHRISELERVVAELKAENGTLSTERDDLYKKIEDGEGVSAAIGQLQQEKASLQEKLVVLETSASTVKSQSEAQIDALHNQVQETKNSLSILHDTNAKLEKQVSEVTAKLNSTLEQLTHVDGELRTKAELLLATELAAKTQRTDLQNHLHSLTSALDQRTAENKAISTDLQKISEELVAKKEALSRINVVQDERETKLKQANERISELDAALAKKTTEAIRFKEACDNLTKNLDASERDVKAKTDAIAAISRANDEMKTRLSAVESDVVAMLAEKQTEIDALTGKLSDFSVSEAALKANVSQAENALAAATENHAEELAALRKSLESCEARLRNSSDTATSKISELTASLEAKEANLKRLEAEKAEQSAKMVELNQSNESLSGQVAKLQGDFKNVSDERNSLFSDLDDLRQQFAVHQKSSQEISKQFDQERNDSSRKIADLSKQTEMFQTQVEKLELAKASLESQMDERSQRFEEVLGRQVALEQANDDLTRELAAEKELKEKELFELERSRNDLREQRSLLQTEMTSLEAKLKEAVGAVDAVRNEAAIVQSNLQADVEQIRSQLKSEGDAKSAMEHALVEKEKQLDLLAENLSSLRSEAVTLQEDLKKAQKLRDEADLKRIEFEAHAGAYKDEKRALMEKCVNLEETIEMERGRIVHLQRRLDDAVAAMHELGRENQSLQIDMSKHSSRRWADDSDALNCTSCGSLFSVTIRKHHCRNCGLIYCNECSSKNATVASSKKPVRVCDNCYQELTSR